MTALSIFAIALSVGSIALCVWTEILRDKEDKAVLNLIKQHNEIMRHITNCMGLLEQRIKKLEEEVKKGENDGRMDKR